MFRSEPFNGWTRRDGEDLSFEECLKANGMPKLPHSGRRFRYMPPHEAFGSLQFRGWLEIGPGWTKGYYHSLAQAFRGGYQKGEIPVVRLSDL